jgi:hypothetical protein
MATDPTLIIQVPRGSSVARQLGEQPPPSAASDQVVVQIEPADELGNLEPPAAGETVLSVPAPEALAREPEEVHRVIAGAGTGVEPLIVIVEAAEELLEEELAPVVEAAGRSSRAVIMRIIRDA